MVLLRSIFEINDMNYCLFHGLILGFHSAVFSGYILINLASNSLLLSGSDARYIL